MKKLLLFMGLLALSSQGWAQDSGESAQDALGFELGLKAGLNNTYIINTTDLANNEHHDQHFNVKPAIIGISAGYKFNDQASIIVEGFWAKQGGNFDILDDNGNEVGEKEIKLDHIVVPIMFKYTGLGETRFALGFGVQACFLASGTETNTFNKDVTYTKTWNQQPKTILAGKYLLATDDDGETTDEPDSGKFNKTEYHLLLDIGLEHDLSENCYLSAGLRGTFGFKDILDRESITYVHDPDKFELRYNAAVGIHVGVHWFL